MSGLHPTFELLLERGLVSVVRADADLVIGMAVGLAASDARAGMRLTDALPALYGQEEDIRALKAAPGERLVLANIGLRQADGTVERYDFAVLFDAAAGEFVVAIVPSLANDAAALDLHREVRARLELERRVAAQATAIQSANEALRRTNDDLKNFTRIISHDLKAPMRAIRYSADDIEAALPDVNAEQADALDELRTHARRMSQMVSGLLAYSRLEDKLVAVAPLDTRELVETIVRSLPRPAGLAVSVCGAWPTVTTIGALLDVVVRNLLDNAIKHHDRNSGEIIVSARHHQDHLEITVIDDGPGIPPTYREAVLRPFIQVHKDRADGSGIGLAMVHKVVTDNGGQMQIGDRGNVQRGTAIVVRWPCP